MIRSYPPVLPCHVPAQIVVYKRAYKRRPFISSNRQILNVHALDLQKAKIRLGYERCKTNLHLGGCAMRAVCV